ncbi:NAD(P)-dependent alcohol dehydrogenase [Rhodococcus opacus]|uniref:Putative oxidoreductase n=1 Tax=Rhodococcus opacus (strain B4) TaxID=632772 RepID=C1B4Z5_RHOOB|nr:NAD(P)-dependent alcohol dehydrogenase [Rhodococcus opacus]BAH50921.1 putative oxidoreductase [Rhodococcus opacus B4]
MKAIAHDVYGPPEILELRDVATPVPADDEVLVRVHAAGVDRGVWHLVTGLPYPVRLAGYGIRRPKGAVPGTDLAGRVEAVGRGVTGFRPGDEVFGIGTGTFAEYACAPAGKLAHKPAGLTFEEAAAVAISGLPALQSVRDHGRVEPGQSVLIIGASGGVGTFAVQIAKANGAEVTGVCSTAKVDLVRSIRADNVVDYTREDFARLGRRYDVILDIGGNASLTRLRNALAPRGRLVIVGGETDGRWLGGTDRQLRALALSPFVSQTLCVFISKEKGEDIRVLRDLVESGDIAPVIDRTYPLAEAGTALRRLVDGQARGKVVLTVTAG